MNQSIHNITFISTIHKEIGKCNVDELCAILEKINPDVVFLEALESTYSNYEKKIFSSLGIYHQRLEIKAIQKYSKNFHFEYVPVLDGGLSQSFDNKYNIVCENIQFRRMFNHYNSLAFEHGFQFLNSPESIKLQENMRMFESHLLKDTQLNEAVNEDMHAYENSMIRNIYLYCKSNQFDKAVFMCGVAHRRSIIEMIGRFNSQEKLDLHWEVYGN